MKLRSPRLLLTLCCIAFHISLLPALATAGVEVARLRQYVEFLAHDKLEGRGPETRGLVAAGSYLAARFAEVGLQPAGDDDSYFQYFEVTTGVVPSGVNALRLSGKNLNLDEDWRPYGFSHVGEVRAPLVFAGYGVRAPEYDYDDYAGLDVEGKVVLVLALEPGQNNPHGEFEGKQLTRHADLHGKAIQARELGAVGMLVVIGPNSDVPERLAPLKAEAGYYSSGILCAQVKRAALSSWLNDFDLAAVQEAIDGGAPVPALPRTEVEVAWHVSLDKRRTKLRNVAGYLPGSDPHRAIVIGAHYDHLGFGGANSLDPDSSEPHNGADDNASGTAALVEIARHFVDQGKKPAQGIVFIAFSGEEIGLAGSAHYVRHPSFPLEYTTAMLNLDMVGRLRDGKLMIFGVETASEFRPLLTGLNTAAGFDLSLKGDGYGPSDQMSFFKKDIPVLHFFTGPHPQYHKPSDDLEYLNFEGLARVADLVAATAEAVMQTSLHLVKGSKKSQTSASSAGVGGFRSYLGTIPDYSQPEDLEGVLLSGVRGGGPADQAGLRGGDLMVQIDSMEIRNIYDYMHVLQTRDPDEKILITVIRQGERLQLPAVLGSK